MNTLATRTKGHVFRPSLPRGEGRPIFRFVCLAFILAVLFMAIGSVYAQPLDTSPAATTAPAINPAVAGSFLMTLVVKYPWLATVLLVMGSLRVLFKPIMMAVESFVANDPAKAAKLESFEHGPVFKWIAIVLDFGASIKLPVIKAAGPTA
jgi:hypothetical protein